MRGKGRDEGQKGKREVQSKKRANTGQPSRVNTEVRGPLKRSHKR